MTRSSGPFDQNQDWQQQPEANEEAHTINPSLRRPQSQQHPEPYQQYPAEPSLGVHPSEQQHYQDQQFTEPSPSQPAPPYNNAAYPGSQAYPDHSVEQPYAQERLPSQGAGQFYPHDGDVATPDYQPSNRR